MALSIGKRKKLSQLFTDRCGYLPTQEQICEACDLIQSGWDEEEEERRRSVGLRYASFRIPVSYERRRRPRHGAGN